MKKVFDQTVRDIKRGVNKKVLKVPSIEQKVLDATSNEPWGPHGSLLADIAQATRNYHEYQMIISVIWKRINDTGKNWRHVYKALIVLEYLIAHGSERVMDDIKEHAYQISTLSDFQYIDSSGKDQGNNVRKKSQSIVALVNDKERIQEVRQKAAANRDKFRSTPTGGMYHPGSGGYGDKYDDDRYGNRDDDRNGYGRDREWGSRYEDRYGRYGESYGPDGDRYGRDNDERFGRDGYKDDDYQERSQSNDDYNYGSRSRSADRERNPANEVDGQYSSRGSGAKVDEQSQDGSTTGKKLESRYSGQSAGAPPSYEDAITGTHSPSYNESSRDGESSQAYAPKASSSKDASPSHTTAAAPHPIPASPPALASPPNSVQTTAQHSNREVDGFDEFDPRGSFSAAPATSNGITPASSAVEMDLLALVPVGQPDVASEAKPNAGFTSGPTFAGGPPPPLTNNQPFDDPFGDGPFRAIRSTDGVPADHQISTSSNSFSANSIQSLDVPEPAPQKPATEVGGALYNATGMPSGPFGMPPISGTSFPQQESSTTSHNIDILADILPPSAPQSFVNAQTGYQAAPNQSVPHSGFPPQTNQPTMQPSLTGQYAPQNGFQEQPGQPTGFPPAQHGQPSLQANYPQPTQSTPQTSFPSQTMALTLPGQAAQAPHSGFHSQGGSMQPNQLNSIFYGAYQNQSMAAAPSGGYMVPPTSTGVAANQNFLSQSGSQAPQVQSSSLVAPVSVTQASTGSAVAPKPSADKFETKSTVWADTLSRGLVNLNISGSKTNPLADIGVDFDALNRKEKRMEKQPATTTVASTVTMGKAMGSGSGVGRAGAGSLRPQPNLMMGSVGNFNMAGGPVGGMGGYGGSQSIGRGMGMGPGVGMNMPGAMGMGMNLGMGQGMNTQQPMGHPPRSTVPGSYIPMMGAGNYSQQPYGGYR
ncbi:clathrin interactor EPSIN 2-like isoform X1 [Salvia splendens]|uniref:clathrin interactor EPSIN 2-like isoform X1 n=1 Tax=Salvia splendens TaxID=180675 RepID=UPI001C26B816|nr:clathrin interactor EPSIN 2-like isoform X1 [Salvia splendens]XP_042010143.1 clathrin interactor EPSIN 2-like isoform X1 [Salvia splendens]